jgi:hypothetical protein
MLFEIIEQALVERNIHERKAFDNVFYSTVWFILAILRVDADPKCVSGIEVVLWFEKVGLKKINKLCSRENFGWDHAKLWCVLKFWL